VSVPRRVRDEGRTANRAHSAAPSHRARAPQVDAVDVDVGPECVRPVEVRAEPYPDDEIHAH